MAMKDYSDEFKADAVALYESTPGAIYKSIAADLGVNRATLREWVLRDRERRGITAAVARPGARPREAVPSAGTSGSWAAVNLTYDPQTGAVTDAKTTDATASTVVDDTKYVYGNGSVSGGAGLVTSTVDKQNGGAVTDTQCYQYDYATRVTAAWSATDNCTATPTAGSSPTVGGPNPYWQTWSYDAAGNRLTQVDHDTSGNTANDTTVSYQYPTQGSATDQPHTLSGTTATGPNATADTATYTYDKAGNTTAISGGTDGGQTLSWNDQGKLATDTTGAGTTTYLYDAEGNLVLRTDPGNATLSLGSANEQLSENTSTSTLSGTRYYTVGGTIVAERSSTGDIQYLIPDRQGTDTLAIDYQTFQVTRRLYLPFGQARGSAPSAWPGDKGYVSGTPDPTTSLENLGAREYDPVTGRFLSADPITETTDPTQLGGYAYAGNDPVTGSDPTGKRLEDPDTGCNGSTAEVESCIAKMDHSSNEHHSGHHGSSSSSSSSTKAIVTKWTSSTGCANSGYDGRVCAAVNGLLTGASTIEGGVSPLAKRWTKMQKILKSPDTTPEQLERALKSLATFLKSPGNLRLVSTHLGSEVQIAGRTFGSAIPRISAVTRYAPYVGAGATGWSDWQGTHNVGEAATETAADVGVSWIAAETGAATGAAIGSAVPVVGTAVGALIGGLGGIALSSLTNNGIDFIWKREDW